MEYMAGGSLRTFRRDGVDQARAAMQRMPDDGWVTSGTTSTGTAGSSGPQSFQEAAPKLTYRQLLALLLEAAQGMAHLHRKDIVHFDLK